MSVYVNPHHYTNMNLIFTQQFLGSSFVSPALGVEGQGRLNMNNKFPPKKSGEARKQAGKKEGGWGEGIFACLLPFPFRLSKGKAEGGFGGNSATPPPEADRRSN